MQSLFKWRRCKRSAKKRGMRFIFIMPKPSISSLRKRLSRNKRVKKVREVLFKGELFIYYLKWIVNSPHTTVSIIVLLDRKQSFKRMVSLHLRNKPSQLGTACFHIVFEHKKHDTYNQHSTMPRNIVISI